MPSQTAYSKLIDDHHVFHRRKRTAKSRRIYEMAWIFLLLVTRSSVRYISTPSLRCEINIKGLDNVTQEELRERERERERRFHAGIAEKSLEQFHVLIRVRNFSGHKRARIKLDCETTAYEIKCETKGVTFVT